MKLRSIIRTVAATVAVGAMATDYTAGNTFARLPVSGAPASAIIALPFSGCGDAVEGSIYVTNLVQTTNLENGDTLMHFNGTKWDAWEINGGAWRSIATSTTAAGVTVSPPASAVAINCGEACWLNRKTPSNTFYLYGQVNATKKSVTVAAGNGTKPTYTIVGCPWEVGSFDVTTIAGGDGDTVLLMDSTAGNESKKVEYTYMNGGWKKKSYTSGSGVTIGGITIPSSGSETYEALGAGDPKTVSPGLGFMYGRKADSTLTITWN